MKKYIIILLFLSGIVYIFSQLKNQKYEKNLDEKKFLEQKENSWENGLTHIKESNRVKIAILDSGISKNHPDLVGKIKGEYNAINVDEPIVDNLGHGTAIAGIIAAKDNDKGVVGISPESDIFSVKVLSDSGEGDIGSLIRGIEWCINNEMDIFNISFGLGANNLELRGTIDKAIQKNIIIVAAAGNNYISKVEYPAKFANVISVGAIDSNLQRASFSSTGKIDFTAPGVNILSTNNLGGYERYSGTSFATAYVTGIIAKVISEEEHYNDSIKEGKVDAVKELLKKLSVDAGRTGYDNEYGYGILRLED
ncbi:S8 family peptidase [Bacillus thuringiensis]|uniref:S8 family peptidase n=2 Tax=Bacillus cereus group TaxID=86661 RepID=UPI00211D2D15|nr:S8 family peptidase [Bacillus thuringiensis]